MVFPPPVFTDEDRAAQQALLTATEWAQPALAVHSLALLEVLRGLGLEPDCVAGHSFGELVALHAAGALDAESLVGLGRRRGELMREAATTPGAMLAVSANRAQVEAAIAGSVSAGVWLANHNAPSQVVVSGATEMIEVVEQKLAADGITTRRLNAATAFHTPVVASASEPLSEFLREVAVGEPRIDVYGNADASTYPSSPGEIRRRIADHLASPVRFSDEIEAMYAAGVRTFVEVGAGATLTGLVGQILGDREHLAVSLDRKGRNGITTSAGRARPARRAWCPPRPRRPVGALRAARGSSEGAQAQNDRADQRQELRSVLPARGWGRRAARAESASPARGVPTRRGKPGTDKCRRAHGHRACGVRCGRQLVCHDRECAAAHGGSPCGLPPHADRQPHGVPADDGDDLRRDAGSTGRRRCDRSCDVHNARGAVLAGGAAHAARSGHTR